MKRIKHKVICALACAMLLLPFGEAGRAFAQNYPIQITTQLAPPFSGFIPDYSTPGNQNLKLLVVFTDFTKPSYNIKLQLKITGQGITIQSKSYYYSGPTTLQPGIPIEISGSDLAGLLNPANLDFSGISPQKYQTNTLPEGFYNICFTAFDYNNLTPIQVSNQSCAFGWMVLSDPPFLNLPFCASTVNVNTPQNMMFQWTPMNMNSPNSATSTLYDFDLYEVRPGSQSPGNIIQTLPPIYQATTPFTFLNYGITEPQLYYGMQYVWRVRARDQSGRDLFKNQGYSQLCTFTYGSVLSQIDTNSLKLTLQGTALTYRLAKYTWDSLSIFLSYKLEYRKQGSPNWFPINTTTCRSIVNNLEPENTYEARVKGIFSEGDGPWSNVVTITTPAKPVIVCGQGGIPPLASNFIPLKTGNIAQVWNIGQFDMLVTQLDNPNSPTGKYSGYGKITIPFLASMNLNGKFSNITVNEAMEVVGGQVEITTTGIDAWLQQWQPPPGWNETDNLHYNGSISTVTTDTGTIFINGQPFGNTGGNALITDDNGNTYYVSADGSISTPEGPLGAPVSDTITSIPDSLQSIVFTDGDNAQFSFDSKEISAQTAGKNYDMLQKGSEKYPVACKLLQTGAQDNLTATLGIAAQEININSLVFKRSDGTIVPSTHSGNTYQLTVKGKLNLFADALWAFAKKNNSSDTTLYPIGKINLISVDKKKKKIVIIPVNSTGINTDAASLQAQINAIYRKVAVEWEVTKAADLQVPGYTSDSLLNVTRSALNITYGVDLRKIINAYKAVDLSIDDATSYLFLVNKATNNDLGYMALNKKFGFIFLDNNSNIPYTIAHEIGHGSLVLEHTFTGETGGTSQNLLDYNNGELFNQRQFKAIHDPNLLQNLLVGLVQDEDAGALVNNLTCAFEAGDKYFIAPNGKVFKMPVGAKIKFLVSGVTQTGITYAFEKDNKLYIADAPIIKTPSLGDYSFNGFKNNGTVYSISYLETAVNVQLIEKENSTLKIFTLASYTMPLSANSNTIDGSLNNEHIAFNQEYYDAKTLLISCNLSSSLSPDNLAINAIFNKFKNKQVKANIFIYQNGYLIKLAPGKPAEKILYTANQLQLLKTQIDNGEFIEPTAVLFEKKSNPNGYNLSIGYNQNLQAKFGNSSAVKQKCALILENRLNEYLKNQNDLTINAETINSEQFPDGKNIKIKQLSFFDKVVTLVSETKEFIEQAQIQPKYYDSEDAEYASNWMNTPPLLTGLGNGVINEVKEIPQLVTMAVDIAINEQTRDKFVNSFKNLTWDKVKNGVTNAAGSWTNTYSEGGDKAWHQGGKDAVMVFTLFGGASLLSGADDLIENQTDDIVGAVESKADEAANLLGHFSAQQIDNFVAFASKQNEKMKIMLGRWDNGAPTSYVSRAGDDHSFFAMADKWEEASNIVGGSFDEMWKINKKYIDNQKALEKEFFFSHDPFSPANDAYFANEVNYLIDLGVTDFQLVGTNLWKAIW